MWLIINQMHLMKIVMERVNERYQEFAVRYIFGLVSTDYLLLMEYQWD